MHTIQICLFLIMHMCVMFSSVVQRFATRGTPTTHTTYKAQRKYLEEGHYKGITFTFMHVLNVFSFINLVDYHFFL